uniref:glutaminase n=1 Tax=Poecilia reticulata TaxID=8081 RepID=A0A3P9MWT6_POERE
MQHTPTHTPTPTHHATHTYTHTHTHLHTHRPTHTPTHTHTHRPTHTPIYTHTPTHTPIYTHTPTHHAYTHTHLHTHCQSGCSRLANLLKSPPAAGTFLSLNSETNHNNNFFCSVAVRRRNPGILPSLEDLLFYTVAEGQEKIPAHKFLTALKATGLRTGDPRLKECMEMLKETLKKTPDGVTLDRHLFKKCVQSNIVLLTQAFRKKFVIPDFQSFTSHIDQLYEKAKNLTGGQVADYIPQLAKFSSDLWAVSLCTVDGQRHTVGDTKVPFCLQSCVKPLKYAVAVHDHGTEYVHSFIGKEPSGLRFNKLFLSDDDKPHNPMVNAGAIVCTSLIQVKAESICAGFQSERESGDRNFAIGYYLKEKKCFPEGTDMTSVLDLYFQLCAIEVTCESASVMAATLANGGICPISGERVLSPEAVRNTLSLMHSCGMYDFSGQFAFHVGLPSKSGVAGGILLVVPNVMGIMCWSPPLDKLGNSVRGIQFCTDLVELFNFHNYDNLRHFAKKHDPRREGGDQRHNFGPMDYESLQQELALKAPLWKKVSPTETDQDSSTTVVYRMDKVAE